MGPLISQKSRLVKYYSIWAVIHYYTIIPEILQFCHYNEINHFERSSSQGSTSVKNGLFQLFPWAILFSVQRVLGEACIATETTDFTLISCFMI